MAVLIISTKKVPGEEGGWSWHAVDGDDDDDAGEVDSWLTSSTAGGVANVRPPFNPSLLLLDEPNSLSKEEVDDETVDGKALRDERDAACTSAKVE